MADEILLGCECGGTGKVSYRTLPSGEINLGDGMTIRDLGGWGTRACECVRDLPAIDGNATWWDMETTFSESVPVPIGDDSIEVTADCEVPRGDDGRRLHRTPENAWYPPLIRMETPGPAVTLFADDARALAAALVKAANACDERDGQTQELQDKREGQT